MSSDVVLTIDDCGCYLDGQRGHYIRRDTIEFARNFGRPTDDVVNYLCLIYDNHCDNDFFPVEFLDAECDDALNWLNENIAPEGTYFAFDDGLYLFAEDEDAS